MDIRTKKLADKRRLSKFGCNVVFSSLPSAIIATQPIKGNYKVKEKDRVRKKEGDK